MVLLVEQLPLQTTIVLIFMATNEKRLRITDDGTVPHEVNLDSGLLGG